MSLIAPQEIPITEKTFTMSQASENMGTLGKILIGNPGRKSVNIVRLVVGSSTKDTTPPNVHSYVGIMENLAYRLL